MCPLPPEQHYARLARKRMSVGVMIFHRGKLLIVEPTYEVHYLIPGGGVDENESPKRAAEREIKEELGLDVEIGRLLVVDYVKYPETYRGECVHYFFETKPLTDAQAASLKLPAEELKGFKFLDPQEAIPLLGKRIQLRVKASIEAIRTSTTIYTENGVQR